MRVNPSRSPCARRAALAALLLGVGVWCSVQAQAAEADLPKAANGTFVSFQDGTLTIQARSGLVRVPVGANYQTFENNEKGPGSKQVETEAALRRIAPGTVMRIDLERGEICYGLDHRVSGAYVSYAEGALKLRAVDVPPGFVPKPAGDLVLKIAPEVPVLESIDGGDFRYAGTAGEVLQRIKPDSLVTARSEYDPEVIEVVQIGSPRRQIERYIGQTRASVRGTLVSFKGDLLRIRGKGLTSLAANEYDRLIGARVPDNVPIVESIDGGAYRPASIESLRNAKEGTVITVRKVEEVLLEIQIGVAK